jgi:membrane protease YdiL (CAAX protease family)
MNASSKEGVDGSLLHSSATTVDTKRLWPLCIFLCLSAAASWAVWFSPIEKLGSFYIVVMGLRLDFPFLLIKLVIGNCLPGILAVIWVLFEGKGQFRGMVSTLTKWRTPLKWYLVAVALPCTVSLISLEAVLFYLPMQHSSLLTIGLLKTLLLTLPFGPLWEELAWRAFVLRKLESHYPRLASALLLGLYWAAWHVPLWLLQLNSASINKVPIIITAFVNLVAWSVIWTYIYDRSSQSLPVVILLHSTYGAATTQVALVAPYLNVYAIYVSAGLAVCLAAILANAMHRVDGRHAQ